MAIECLVVIALAAAARALVKKLSGKATKVIDGQVQAGGANTAAIITEGAVAAVNTPAQLLLPLAAAAYALRTIVLGLEIVIRTDMHNRHGFKHLIGNIFRLLTTADQTLMGVSQVAIIGFTCWFFLAWKQQLANAVTAIAKSAKESGGAEFGLERVVLPFSTLAGWGIVVVGALSSLHVLGVNIQPLLTVGGVGGLAVGFGAQAVTSNAISGINLFVTRPFVVGDRVKLSGTGGGVILTGVVERIDPMRTCIRTDDSVPVAIPNKAITEMMVSNESRLGSSPVVQGFKDPRRYSNIVSLPASDFKKVPQILDDLRSFLSKHPGVDRSLPVDANVDSMNSNTIQLGITAHTTAVQSREFGAFNAELLMETARVLESNRAGSFAVG